MDSRASPIEDGNPLIGTWNQAFDKVDLLEIRKPYPHFMPCWLRNWRIKEWESFNIQNENIMLNAIFCDVKLYKIAHVLFYDKKSKEKYFFRKLMPYTSWNLPKSLANASLENHSSDFYFRIHNWLDADIIKLDMNIEAASFGWRAQLGRRTRSSLTAHLAYKTNSQITPLAVSLGFAERRTMYAYKTFTPVQGDIVFNGQYFALKQETCSGFFCDYKGFFPYRMQAVICSAMGFDEKKRKFGFHIAENQAKETNKNNENALWVNGQLTPLPPVLITMPNGAEAEWVIQDVEGMVDLTFTPIEQNKSTVGLVITSAEFNAPFGYYNGMLVNSDGEQIQIKNLFGMGEKLYLRV